MPKYTPLERPVQGREGEQQLGIKDSLQANTAGLGAILNSAGDGEEHFGVDF